jgi:hypothetical protein
VTRAATSWYYTRKGQRFGPVSGAQLQQLAQTGELTGDNLVWTEKLKAWTPASKIKGLIRVPPDALPPPSVVNPQPVLPKGLISCPVCGQPVSEQAAACPKCAHPIAPVNPTPTVPQSSGPIRVITQTEEGEQLGCMWCIVMAIVFAFGVVGYGVAYALSGGNAWIACFGVLGGAIVAWILCMYVSWLREAAVHTLIFAGIFLVLAVIVAAVQVYSSLHAAVSTRPNINSVGHFGRSFE